MNSENQNNQEDGFGAIVTVIVGIISIIVGLYFFFGT